VLLKKIKGVSIFYMVKSFSKVQTQINIFFLRFLGVEIGDNLIMNGIPEFTWYNRVSLGNNVKLEKNIYFKYVGFWENKKSICIGDNSFIGRGVEFNISKSITIGDNCLIASGCKFIDHDHGLKLGGLMRLQRGSEKEIILGDDVWLGVNVIVLKGVTISDGVVIGSGSVVTKNIPANEVWGGVPAKKIAERK
tara:strand:- start:8919 stop:9497 length:579 start_codon:yes stop_codon:yes gene_type:complete